MRLSVTTEPQEGADYETQLRVALAAEKLEFEAFFRSDHYLREGAGDGLPGPTDAWITLAALARETERIRLGSLMTSATFRYPGPLAMIVAQVDRMSGGRVEFGLGAGWYEEEHRAHGIPFPATPKERFDRFEEQLAIITGMWSTPVGSIFGYQGSHYQMSGSPALPKPKQDPRPPIIVGGTGKKRLPRIAATYADEYNSPFTSLKETSEAFSRVRRAVAEHRPDRTVVLSTAQTLCCGRTRAEIARRAERTGLDPAALAAEGLYGTPEEVVERACRFAEIGADRLYLQIMDLTDLEQLELVATEVAPHLKD